MKTKALSAATKTPLRKRFNTFTIFSFNVFIIFNIYFFKTFNTFTLLIS